MATSCAAEVVEGSKNTFMKYHCTICVVSVYYNETKGLISPNFENTVTNFNYMNITLIIFLMLQITLQLII